MQTFMRLTSLFEQRGDSYANASARVSLESKWRFVALSLCYDIIVKNKNRERDFYLYDLHGLDSLLCRYCSQVGL